MVTLLWAVRSVRYEYRTLYYSTPRTYEATILFDFVSLSARAIFRTTFSNLGGFHRHAWEQGDIWPEHSEYIYIVRDTLYI